MQLENDAVREATQEVCRVTNATGGYKKHPETFAKAEAQLTS
jgi:hypothetical protein